MILMTAIARVASIEDNLLKETSKAVESTLYPFLILFSLISNASFYCGGQVYEREQKIRHLLKFHGIGSAAYIMGMTFAEWVIHCTSSAIIILVGMTL